ncbi:MAG: hypothetical protein CR991_09255 [Proteobacteria bacterium]|nr:MAG: hypothetical protein CR991_09255 [Pseudomonadota bacterium]
MSSRLPVEVNPFRLIEQGKILKARLPIEQMPRLRELLVESANAFEVELHFGHSDSRRPMITGHIQGEVSLRCQRCLEPIAIEMDTWSEVVLTTSQTDRIPEEEGYELYIIDNERLFLQDFIEDEILLALPVVPRHEDCHPIRPLCETDADDVWVEQAAQEEKTNPFAVLKDWKKTE